MYFSHFPYVFYDVEKTGNVRPVTHILKRIAFRQKVKDRANLFYTHYIEEGDTPEILSYKVYGHPEYHWVLLLLNERHNPYFDWPMSYQAFEAYLTTKYPGKVLYFGGDFAGHFTVGETVTGGTSNATGTVTKWLVNNRHLVVNVGSGTFQDGEVITGGTSGTTRTIAGTVNYVDADHHWVAPAGHDLAGKEVSVGFSPAPDKVTNRQYEDNINETNRSIKILKPEFLSIVVEEFKTLLQD